MHTFGDQTAFFALGDSTSSPVLANAATDTVHPYLTGVEMDAPGASAVVALGDSLTDGMLSSKNQNLRWTDDLARQLQMTFADRMGVVNEGIAGNCVVASCMGPSMLERFKRDVSSVAGVKYLILLAGENDIGNAAGLAAKQLTDAYRSMVELAHAQSILVYGATIPPFGGSNFFTAAREKLRQEVNDFIRNGAVFDAFIDFDKALADPVKPAYLLAELGGDKIRPNDAGYQAMANAVDLSKLQPAQ
jgi:lysophospholipase L1-like esterase